ncbi:putative spore protein YtfJ, partial [Chryseobacterium ginsenosidimutans]|nr:putative spore protein YtfJ [Chryseobacterium ginsenosidimutans]
MSNCGLFIFEAISRFPHSLFLRIFGLGGGGGGGRGKKKKKNCGGWGGGWLFVKNKVIENVKKAK